MTNNTNIHKTKSDKWECKLTNDDIIYVTISLKPTAAPSSNEYTGGSDLTIFVTPDDFTSLIKLHNTLTNLIETLKEAELL